MIPFSSLLLSSRTNALAPGHMLYTTPGVYNTVVPNDLYEISALCIGGGASGGQIVGDGTQNSGSGGGLRWRNNIRVVPGQTLKITVGDHDQDSKIELDGVLILAAFAGRRNTTNSLGAPGGGGNDLGLGGGGNGGASGDTQGGGGGAGGYSGKGGDGSVGGGGAGSNGASGAGGGGGGGGAAISNGTGPSAGGGVGVYGEGQSGAGGVGVGNASATGGGGGSGGVGGGSSVSGGTSAGGLYGGGAPLRGVGGKGAVRIVFGRGPNNGGRAFPATNVATATS